QNIKNPWLHENLTTMQIEQLFDITPEMQILIDQRLHDYLFTILTEASIEKSENTNIINDLIANQKIKIDKKN
ncbi:12717_t:CDS:1, partial [Racocetra persica]